ncbi:MAG: AI-2E family transporter [Leptospiraceae bacterium]|nr:AI-2E family transporter [Leptospiraceae bacterium]
MAASKKKSKKQDRKPGRASSSQKSKTGSSSAASPVQEVLSDEERNPAGTALREVGLTPLAMTWFGILFLSLAALIVYMAWPYITAVVFGLIVAGAFYPLMAFFADRLGWNRGISAALVMLIILFVVLLPVAYMIVQLIREVKVAVDSISANLTQDEIKEFLFGDASWFADLGRELFHYFDEEYSLQNIQAMVVEKLTGLSSIAVNSLQAIVSNVFSFLFQFVIMLIVIYTIFLKGPRLKEFLLELSPLPREDEELLIDRFNQMNYVTLICNGLGGLIQGVLAGIGFYFAGVTSILLWTVMMTLLAFIPLVGISFVYVPVCIYKFIIGDYWTGAILFIWCTIVALVVENWFKPIFMGNRVQINSMLVFLSIIGGMTVFNAAGIFYGPLIVIIFLTFVQLYHERYARNLNT